MFAFKSKLGGLRESCVFPPTPLAGVVFFAMERYSIIHEKNPREIVLLRGSGCVYRKCTFCDYHTDCSADAAANFALNADVLARVTGEYGNLEVINSGSVFELDAQTLARILEICMQKQIRILHFEAHDLYRDRIPALRAQFAPIQLKMKLGLETFDFDLREHVLCKGIPARDPAAIAAQFEEANFLFGITGQTADSMRRDIELGLQYFERVCVNIICENTTAIKPDSDVIEVFLREIYPAYREHPRIDILLQNTDFGVGA